MGLHHSRKAKRKSTDFSVSAFFGGDKRDRTADLLNAIQALSQLSYTPEYFALSLSARDILPETSGFVNTILKIFCFFLEPGRWPLEEAAPGRRGGPPRRVAPERALAC